MLFGGIQKTSLVDYPELIADVVFAKGCNLRCPYCHNSHVLSSKSPAISEQEILSMLDGRQKFIDAVVVSGGEPTLWGDELVSFIAKVKVLGYLVKLDTNGTAPELIQALITGKLVDYVAMDIKAPLEKYEQVARVPVDVSLITKSIDIVSGSGIPHEYRITVCKELHDRADVAAALRLVPNGSVAYLQNFCDRDTVLVGKGKLSPVDFLDEFTGPKVHVR